MFTTKFVRYSGYFVAGAGLFTLKVLGTERMKVRGVPIPEGSSQNIVVMTDMLTRLQEDIAHTIGELDGKPFLFDPHDAKDPKDGSGRIAVLQDGNVFEKAGVALTVKRMRIGPQAAMQLRPKYRELLERSAGEIPLTVAGLSLVMHPKNPMAPTVHLNYRYIEATVIDRDTKESHVVAWYAGGADLTPSYLFEEDAVEFHQQLKLACDAHDTSLYPEFKKECDKYFYNPFRKESRGVGGIFFDDLDKTRVDNPFMFVKHCADAFLKSYPAIVARRCKLPFTEQEKLWQQLRRGRYVEFNLQLDRGTQYGFKAPDPQVENILMSLPLTARWEYKHAVVPGSREAEIQEVLVHPRDWIPLAPSAGPSKPL